MMKNNIPRSWLIFAATCSLFVMSQFHKTCVAVITPQLMADLALDARGIGLMSAAFYYTFALTQIPMGIYLDRVGPRITMTILSLIAVAGGLIFARSDSLWVSAIGRALLGVGMACNLMGSFKLLTLWFSPLKFATLSSLVLSIGSIGTVASATPLVLMTQAFGWRQVFILLTAVTFVSAVIFFLVVRDKPDETPYGARPKDSGKNLGKTLSGFWFLLQQKDYWIVSFANFGRFGIFFAFQGLWAGPYLMEVMELSPIHTGNIILLVTVGYIVGGPLFGLLSDSVLKTRKWIAFTSISALALLLCLLAALPGGTSPWVIAVIFFVFGLFSSAGIVMYVQIKELVPSEMAGTAMAGINFFAFVGAAAFLHGLGSLTQSLYPDAAFGAGAFKVTFLICAGYLVVSTALYLWTKDTGRPSNTYLLPDALS